MRGVTVYGREGLGRTTNLMLGVRLLELFSVLKCPCQGADRYMCISDEMENCHNTIQNMLAAAFYNCLKCVSHSKEELHKLC